jgi:uncharacterized phage protein (TIGR01671 family)
MKREILFKARRADGKGWVKGGLITCPTEIWILPSGWELSIILEKVEVLPATVCQYTGLKDKNGVKIFEGDLLNIKDVRPHEEAVFDVDKSDYDKYTDEEDEVKMLDGIWCIDTGENHLGGLPISGYSNFNLRVTGNIHDND